MAKALKESKTVVKKTAEPKAKTEKVEKTVAASKAVKSGKVNLSIPVYSLDGASQGNLDLPETIFGQKVNKSLLAQALRVYTTNMKAHNSNTKTRGEMSYSTVKIFRQKGTGNARHGSRSAPTFVHSGGIALGPKYRKTMLDLPKKMKKAALLSALSQKALDQEILALDSVDKATGKTKEMVKLLNRLSKKSALVVTDKLTDAVKRSTNNLAKVDYLVVSELNAYQVLNHRSLIITKDAVVKLATGNKEEETK